LSVLEKYPIDTGGIRDVQNLRNHIVQAARLELSTIPLYLYAAYSIQTGGYSQWSPGMSAFRSIRSVVIEEMLHLSLARNLLVAVGGGGQYRCYDPALIPAYPELMLHRTPDLCLHLEPCTVALMKDVFMPLEQPAESHAKPQPNRYNTIGQFYAAIRDGFEYLDKHDKELWSDNNPDLQYSNTYWNQDGGGSPVVVVDLASACTAIDTIVEQGEGASPGDDEVTTKFPYVAAKDTLELSHYAKFQAIAEGIDAIGEVWQVPTDPKASDYSGPVAGLATLFNAAYCYVLCMIDEIYSTTRATVEPGNTSARYGLERTFIAAMGGLLYPIGDLLVRQQLGSPGHNAAPTFEYYEFAKTPNRKDQLAALCDAMLPHYPSLGGDNGVRHLIERLPSV
jgi:hypothetical protein